MEFENILSKFIYRIESKPSGGFIATCKDSTAPAIEGATRQEVQRKIQESIAANLGTQLPALRSALAGNEVKLHYHVEAKPGGGFVIHHGDPNSLDPEHAPIEGSTREHLENVIESKIFRHSWTGFHPNCISKSPTNSTPAASTLTSTARSASPAAESRLRLWSETIPLLPKTLRLWGRLTCRRPMLISVR